MEEIPALALLLDAMTKHLRLKDFSVEQLEVRQRLRSLLLAESRVGADVSLVSSILSSFIGWGSLSHKNSLHTTSLCYYVVQNGLLQPLGNDWMAAVISRLLIRDKSLRDKLGKGA